ncbi:hypothetical protein VCB98_00700 [Gammaproteobacteria bacterium AB-CW1]|uniref:Uncharacterized protein n=1 Tax=Natronospira elongata TaxID=3110268 RepID=A0AAP6JCN2_9GAMM|nr:hypothetical protein [Gammaproteobacteria bacterium AB-CW1]
MREWLSQLPVIGRLFTVPVPEERQIEPPSNPQLNAERARSRQLSEELEQLREKATRLDEQVRELEARGAANESKIQALEEMLADPDRAQNAIVYYQLREIWFACHRELVNLVKELSRHMEQEERQQMLARYRQEQEREATELERSLEDLAAEQEEIEQRRRKLQEELSRSQRIWHYFKRKRLTETLAGIADELKPVDAQMSDLRNRIREVQGREPPTFIGLSVEGRRQVNLAAIALAQYLYLRFRKDSIADMARSARRKPVHEAYFGPTDECLKIMRQIREVEGRWRSDRERPEKVRRRARYLAGMVKYKEAKQTAPDMKSMDHLQPSISAEGSEVVGDSTPLPVNVLEWDLWDLREAMLGAPPAAVEEKLDADQ